MYPITGDVLHEFHCTVLFSLLVLQYPAHQRGVKMVHQLAIQVRTWRVKLEISRLIQTKAHTYHTTHSNTQPHISYTIMIPSLDHVFCCPTKDVWVWFSVANRWQTAWFLCNEDVVSQREERTNLLKCIFMYESVFNSAWIWNIIMQK